MSDRVSIDWQEVIKTGTRLPSLPGVAVEIVRLANSRETNVEEVVSILSKDPAVTGKLLRAVNSPIYAKPREVESLKQAVIIMGIDSALNLALSFSLINSMKQTGDGGLDYDLYWRRALLSATAARVIAVHAGELALEEIFLAALLQDIGMLVVDRINPDFYLNLGQGQANHDQVIKYENEHLESDHAQIGGLLLRKWHLPDRTSMTVYASHDTSVLEEDDRNARFANCVALSSAVSDLFLGQDKFEQYGRLVLLASSQLQLKEFQVQRVIEQLAESIPGVESLFAVRLVSGKDVAEIVRQAHEALKQRMANG